MMEKYLDTLFWDICKIKFTNGDKDKCLFEFDLSVEKTLFIIFLFSQHYCIKLEHFYEKINKCSYNEILNIGKNA